MEEVPVFRAAKRRKFARRRPPGWTPEDGQPTSPFASDGDQPADDDNDNDQQDGGDGAVTTLIRARRNVKKPVTGVQFSTTRSARKFDGDTSQSAVKSVESVEKPIDITDRFVGGTGQVVNVDKHMVAFIDSELARRRTTAVPTSYDSQIYQEDGSERYLEPLVGASVTDRKNSSANPVAARQLAEVDLGNSAHVLNLARTQAALERVKTGQAPIEDEVKPPKPRKPRLGRDGKPFRPRPRKGRNSEDIARDALVEQFLHENKIEMYETGTPEATPATEMAGKSTDDRDADEKFAEQFRQDFMDAMADRRTKAKTTTQAKGAVAPEPRGPKLGGSRSARAKMAQLQQEQQQPGASKK